MGIRLLYVLEAIVDEGRVVECEQNARTWRSDDGHRVDDAAKSTHLIGLRRRINTKARLIHASHAGQHVLESRITVKPPFVLIARRAPPVVRMRCLMSAFSLTPAIGPSECESNLRNVT